jgi:hypothetical protein
VKTDIGISIVFGIFAANQQPYMIQFQSDGVTVARTLSVPSLKGFKLIYWQSTTC